MVYNMASAVYPLSVSPWQNQSPLISKYHLVWVKCIINFQVSNHDEQYHDYADNGRPRKFHALFVRPLWNTKVAIPIVISTISGRYRYICVDKKEIDMITIQIFTHLFPWMHHPHYLVYAERVHHPPYCKSNTKQKTMKDVKIIANTTKKTKRKCHNIRVNSINCDDDDCGVYYISMY